MLVLMPHSRCNCRCVMCDIWKANSEKKEISTEELEKHLESFKSLGVKRVALSGGEALMHPNLWKFCDRLHSIGVKISLLSTGVTLKEHASQVIQNCDDVIVSLDGDPDRHNLIRNIPKAFERLADSVAELKRINPGFRVTGRTVIQRQNFRHFPDIIRTARRIHLDQISFLAADVSSTAFNRTESWMPDRVSSVALNGDEAVELEIILRNAFIEFEKEFAMGFIAESKEKMLSIVRHYKAHEGLTAFPKKKCNAPWVSAVVESNGDVLPCFFHPRYGNLNEGDFKEIINSPTAINFRKNLSIDHDPTCQRCVCSLYVRNPKLVS